MHVKHTKRPTRKDTAAETKKTLEDPISKNKPRKRVLEHLALQLQT